MLTCAICGWAVGAGRHHDAQGAPVHYYCAALRIAVQANVAALRASLPPLRPRRRSMQSVRAVRAWGAR